MSKDKLTYIFLTNVLQMISIADNFVCNGRFIFIRIETTCTNIII